MAVPREGGREGGGVMGDRDTRFVGSFEDALEFVLRLEREKREGGEGDGGGAWVAHEVVAAVGAAQCNVIRKDPASCVRYDYCTPYTRTDTDTHKRTNTGEQMQGTHMRHIRRPSNRWLGAGLLALTTQAARQTDRQTG